MRIWTSIEDWNLKNFKTLISTKNENINVKNLNNQSKENIKKLNMNSNLLTSSKDNTMILWTFIIQNINNDEFTNLSSKSSFGFSHFLQPIPLRNFVFSSPPTKGLCFEIKNNEKLGLMKNSEKKSVFQINVIVDGRVITVIKNEKKNVFKIDQRFMNTDGNISIQINNNESLKKRKESLSLNLNLDIFDKGIRKDSLSISTPSKLTFMPVICQLKR